MRLLVDRLGGLRSPRRSGLLDFSPLNKERFNGVVVLGKYDNASVFGGTDMLSLAVQPDAEKFVLRPLAGLNGILFEGDRLSNASFMAVCKTAGEMRLVVLTPSRTVLEERRSKRVAEVGKVQNKTWLKGRESKVDSLIYSCDGETRKNDTQAEVEAIVQDLHDWILGLSDAPPRRSNSLF